MNEEKELARVDNLTLSDPGELPQPATGPSERRCGGCGARGWDQEWATITVLVSDGTTQKYVPIGYYCAHCKSRDWAYVGRLTLPDWLFTEHELLYVLGIEGLRPNERDDSLSFKNLRRTLANQTVAKQSERL